MGLVRTSAVSAGLNSQGTKANDEHLTSVTPAGVAWDNWFLKHQYALNRDALAELENAAIGRAQMQKSLTKDDTHWHGWYARNGGSVRFLGDDFAAARGIGFPAGLLILVLVGLLHTLLKHGLTPSARA